MSSTGLTIYSKSQVRSPLCMTSRANWYGFLDSSASFHPLIIHYYTQPALSSPNVSDPTAPISVSSSAPDFIYSSSWHIPAPTQVVVELWSYFRRIVRAQALAGRRRHGGRRSGRSAPSAQQLEIITNNAITSGLVKALSEIDRSLRHQWNTMTVSRRQELLIEVESFMMYAYGRSSSTVRDVLKNNGNHAVSCALTFHLRL